MTNLTDRLTSVGEPAARALMTDLWSGSTPEVWAAQPAAWSKEAKARRFLAPAGVASAATLEATGARSPVVLVGSDYIAKITDPRRGHGSGARPTRPQDFARVQSILDDGELVERRDRRSVYVLNMDDGLWTMTVNVTRQGELAVLSLFAINEAKAARLRRRGAS